MAHQTVMSTRALIAALDSVTKLLDEDEKPAILAIYAGVQPPSVQQAADGKLLATFEMDRPCFKAAVPVQGGVIAECSGMPKKTHAEAGGTATYFRAFDGGWRPLFDGSVGTSGCDMTLDSVDFVPNQSVEIKECSLTLPER